MKLVLLAILLSTGLAMAENNEAPVAQVKRLLHTAIEESTKNHDYGTPLLSQTLNSLEGRGLIIHSGWGVRTEPNEYSLLAIIDTVEILSRSPQLQGECRTLRLKLRAQMEAQDAVLAEKIAEGIANILRQALAAKDAKDLQASKAALEKLVFEGQAHGESRVDRLVNGPQYQVLNLLTRLQEVVSANGALRFRSWETLNGFGSAAVLYLPRSEYLERLAQFRHNHDLPKHPWFDDLSGDKLCHVIEAISSPSGIPHALEQLDEVARGGNGSTMNELTLRNTQEILKRYQQIYLDLAKGAATRIDTSTTPLAIPQLMPAFPQQDWPPEPSTSIRADVGSQLARLRDQLIRLALPRILGLPETSPSGAMETVPAYLQRVANLAQKDSDWDLLLRIMEMKQTLKVGVSQETDDAVQTLRAFHAGLEQERASDYVGAAQSFQAALQIGAQIPTAELIAGHLERLRREHAPEFAMAMSKLKPPPTNTEAANWSVGYLLREQERRRRLTPTPPGPTFLEVPAKREAK